MRDSHVGCVLYNGKENHYQIRSWIQIMRNVRVLSNQDRACIVGSPMHVWWENCTVRYILVLSDYCSSPITNDYWNSWIYIIRNIFRHSIITAVSKLEQLERLRSEDTPRRPVITLTIDQFILNPKSILLISSYRIPSQKKVKAEKIRKICEKI